MRVTWVPFATFLAGCAAGASGQTIQPVATIPNSPEDMAEREARPATSAPVPNTSEQLRGAGQRSRAEFGQQRLAIAYEPSIAFRQNAGKDDELGWFGHDLRLSAPLYQDEQNEWLLLAKVAELGFYGDAKIPDSNGWRPTRRTDFPDHLWDIELGTSYRRKLTNDWILGGTLTVGSPSDEPFASGEETLVDFTGSLRIPHGETNAWLIYVNWTNVRDFAEYVPLPGIGYEFEAGPTLSGVAGVPFSLVRYRPVDWLVLRGSYFFPHTIDTEIAVPVTGWELFTGYEWQNDLWLWSERRDDDDRLQYYEQSLKLGVRSPTFLDGRARVEVEGGYAFQRYWFVGDEYGDRKDERLGIGDGPYAKVQLRVEF